MNRVIPADCIETRPSTISDAMRLQAGLHPDRPAIFCSGLPALSFGELDRTIKWIGDDLHAAGVGAGSRVGVMLPHGPEAAVVVVAISAHAICYPLDPALTAAEFEHEVGRIGLDAIVLPDRTDLPASRAARAYPIGILHAAKATRSLADVRVAPIVDIRAERRRSGSPSARSVALIQTSSGSTGMPKHVLVTHANLSDVAKKVRAWFGVSEHDRSACILPLHSGIALKVSLFAPLLIGSSVVIAKKPQPEDIAEWCADLSPTWFIAVPAHLNAALDKLRSMPSGKLKHSLRFFVATGTHCPEQLLAELEAILGIPGLEQYGAREAGPITANPAPPAKRKPGTVGPISADVAVLDSDGAVLPHGMPGAIAARGRGISPGYVEALPSGSDTVPDGRSPDEWMPTGDLGIVDADGFLSIVGRTKQIINRGGEKIAPSEIERALLLHPAVREAAVFDVPHPRLGEGVSAAVVLRPETEVTPAELQSFLDRHVAPFKIPQRIHLVSALPRTQAGKIQISELKEHFSNSDREIVPPEGNLEPLIVEIWERLLGRTDIGVDDNFFDMGGDSLLATTMLLEIEALARRTVSPAELQAVWTVRQLARALRDVPADRELIVCAKNGSGAPFFFCHGDYRDGGIYAYRLADLIEQNVPIFLLNHYRDFLESSQRSLEEMARLYVPNLIACQPAGRFRVGGYCIGGLLAWEIARQLRAAGRDVEFVVLVDSPSLNGRADLRAIKRVFGALSRVFPKGIREKIERNGMWAVWVALRSRPAVWAALRKLARFLAVRRSSENEACPPRWDEYRRLSNYVPESLDAELFALVCADNATRLDFQSSNWRRLAPSVHVKVVPGNHHSCVTTHAGVVAAELQSILSASRVPESASAGRLPHGLGQSFAEGTACSPPQPKSGGPDLGNLNMGDGGNIRLLRGEGVGASPRRSCLGGGEGPHSGSHRDASRPTSQGGG
jgi:acyl-CoA synthetase (AMP-forming)/AMP-acid ligase II/thioesterase domain-containing protein